MDSPSDKKTPHPLLRTIDDLCKEVDDGLASLAAQLSDKTVNELQLWLQRTYSSPYRNTEHFLALADNNGFPERCCAWLANTGIKVFSAEPENIRGRQALMRWCSELRKRRVAGDLCVFIRKLNLLSVAEQQEFWASWVGTLSPHTRERFAYSFLPFTEDFEHMPKHDVWIKFGDRSRVLHDDA